MAKQPTQMVHVRLMADFYLKLRIALLQKGMTLQDFTVRALLDKVERDGLLKSAEVRQAVETGLTPQTKLTDAERIQAATRRYYEKHHEPIRLRALCRDLQMDRQRVEELQVEAKVIITGDKSASDITTVAAPHPSWVYTIEEFCKRSGDPITMYDGTVTGRTDEELKQGKKVHS